MARPMPVLPDVPSMIVPPGFSAPLRSASSIILTAMRSLIELPGLNVSSLTRTVPLTWPRVSRLMRTIGVSPIASRIELQIVFTLSVYTAASRAQIDCRANDRRRSRHEAQADRRVRRPREFRGRARERGADDVAARLGGAGPAAGVRGDHRRAARDGARRIRRR